MHRSGHVDTFTRDRLPPRELWPDLLLDRPEFRYPERLNCVSVLLDRWIAEGKGDRPASDFASRDMDLWRARRAREPHRQCAGRAARSGRRQPSAAALGQQSDNSSRPISPS